MNIEIVEWALIIIVSFIMAWEKSRKWYFRRNGKDRRSPNPHADFGFEIGQLKQAFADHEKHDDKRTDEIKEEMRQMKKTQGRHTTAIAILKSKTQ